MKMVYTFLILVTLYSLAGVVEWSYEGILVK